MSDIEKHLKLPKPLSKKDEELLAEFDAAEVLPLWAAKVAKERIHHKCVTDWNAPRRPFVLHPSAADNPCDYYLYMQIVGGEGQQDIPPSTQMIYDTGTAIHMQLQYYMETRASFHKYQYSAEVGFGPSTSPNASALKMAGHIDGVSRGWPLKDSPLVWEFKTINKSGFERLTSPHSGYVKQAHLYMLAVGAPVAIILYICKDNSQLNAFKLPFDEAVWRPMLKRLLYIRECARKMEDPERRISTACKRCRFRVECQPDLSGLGKSRGRLPRKL